MTTRQVPAIMLLLCLALGACRTTDDPAQSASPAPAPAAAPAAGAATAEPAPAGQTPAQRRQPAQAARGSVPPPAAPAKPEPPDADQVLAIRQMCWSEVDKNRAVKTLEARADWVSKCIADKSKAAGL